MAVTRSLWGSGDLLQKSWLRRLLAAGLALATAAHAAVLPEDRLDIMYHSYDGGGVKIDGPSILVRKEVANTASVYANYYVDMISGASIDVEVSGASKYAEERTEYSLGAEYLHDRTIMSLSYTNSSENDYEADTVSFGISQEFFGSLTTLSMGFSLGDDKVRDSTRPDFEEPVEHRRYKLGLSQVITKNWITSLDIESVVDEGFLQNPYRKSRYRDASNPAAPFTLQNENYPNTRNSDAIALRSMYYLPYRAALRAEYRHFNDNWDIVSDNYELRYIHPIANNWIFEVKYRFYDQSEGAFFFNDLMPFRDAFEFHGRDKELSVFTNKTFGLGVSYQFRAGLVPFFDKSTVNFYWDHMQFDFDEFRDARVSQNDPTVRAGAEPLYSFDADVIRLFFSFWF